MQRHPAGYDPPLERSTSHFDAMGDSGVLNDVISDLSFPRNPRTQLMARGGTESLCRHCLLRPEDRQTPRSAAGYEPLGGGQTPGVHPDVTDGSAHNATDDLYADPRPGEFGVGRSAR